MSINLKQNLHQVVQGPHLHPTITEPEYEASTVAQAVATRRLSCKIYSKAKLFSKA